MEIISHSVKETLNIGRKIAGRIKKGDIICLFGQLGSGKTVLAKGIATGLGLNGKKVISPSFVLIRQYTKGGLHLYHLDLYRLKSGSEIFSLGCEEYFYDGQVTVVEWAERLGVFLPKEYLRVELKIKKNKHRLLKLTGIGRRYKELIERLK